MIFCLFDGVRPKSDKHMEKGAPSTLVSSSHICDEHKKEKRSIKIVYYKISIH